MSRTKPSIDRREFLINTTLAGAALAGPAMVGPAMAAAATPAGASTSAIGSSAAVADSVEQAPARKDAPPVRQAVVIDAALRPRQNQFRNVLDLSGLWQFQTDPDGIGETWGWQNRLPAPRDIAVPSSWNELFDDLRDYLGPAWYAIDAWVPQSWFGQRVCLRVGSATYAARVWVNGTLAGTHEGGHLPFAFDITTLIQFDRATHIVIQVENLQKMDRIPPGPAGGAAGGGPGAGALFNGYPATSYDFFPFAGLHRQVLLYSVPPTHVTGMVVQTAIEGTDGLVTVNVTTTPGWSGKGLASIAMPATPIDVPIEFKDGAATATLRIPSAQFWTPRTPYLYPLTVTLRERNKPADAYTLDIGVRTIKVDGQKLLLNGEPIQLTGFGRHEDFPIHGRGLDLPVLVRDYDLLKWIGANSYRTSHYPYSEEALDLADRQGLLIINEIPAVSLRFTDDEATIATRLTRCEQEMRDLIARDHHHPSVIMWSVANEPMAASPLTPAPGGPDPKAVAAGTAFLTRLLGLTRELDPSRPATLVGAMNGPIEWLALADVVCVNLYFGWYMQAGQLQEAAIALGAELDTLHTRLKKPILVSEYGADTVPGWHSEPAEMWTEEYQSAMLTMYLDVTAARPFVIGLHVWNFADFKTTQGVLRAGGLNRKGVFTRDRRPKLAAHTLRARWRPPTPLTNGR